MSRDSSSLLYKSAYCIYATRALRRGKRGLEVTQKSHACPSHKQIKSEGNAEHSATYLSEIIIAKKRV